MRHISILVPKGDLILSSVVGPVKVFNWVNAMRQREGLEPAYHVDLVGVESESTLHNGFFAIRPNKHVNDVRRTDLVLIPALSGDVSASVADNAELITWMRDRRGSGAEVGSLCTGAFLLAATGLMDGLPCTTHWLMADLFRKTYPNVDLRVERIITDQNGIYSSGGAYSFLNLVLHLVEKHNGRPVALQAAKMFEIEI
ncbi:MAG TPA: DJ-1/PfpI family protein, partial [Flavobacteriales bacterium]|nr:DJ-1/PfpI family protein [Flavobacteriales bacterium]